MCVCGGSSLNIFFYNLMKLHVKIPLPISSTVDCRQVVPGQYQYDITQNLSLVARMSADPLATILALSNEL